MNKILIAVFDSEKAAYEGVAGLKDLHRDGDISLYASSVIAKDAAGAVTVTAGLSILVSAVLAGWLARRGMRAGPAEG